jgi:hypothetical protein
MLKIKQNSDHSSHNFVRRNAYEVKTAGFISSAHNFLSVLYCLV